MMAPHQHDRNGLTWQQVAALIGILSSIGGVWVRMEVNAAETRQAIAMQPSPIIVEQRFGELRADMAVVKSEITALKSEVRALGKD